MKLKMARNSLFAVLLRSSWWISALIAAVLVLLALALLPAQWRAVGAFSAAPFVVIAAIAARRQWRLPSAAQVQKTEAALRTMAWAAFADQLEAAFSHDGWQVQRVGAGSGDSHDFELARGGERRLVSARRWKTAQIGIEPLRALQAAREKGDVSHAMLIALGPMSDAARPFAARHGIVVWGAAELAQALRGRI